MTGTVTKALLLRQDMALWDGKTLAGTRTDSTGGTISGLRINDVVDVLSVYGDGTDYTRGTINDAVNSVGSTECTFLFSPGTWDVDGNITIPNNISVFVAAGAVFDISSGITLTIAGKFTPAGKTYTSGTGTLSLTGSWTNYQDVHVVDDQRFGAKNDGTDTTAAIQTALDLGGRILIPEGTWSLADSGSGRALNIKSNTILSGAGHGRSILQIMNAGDATAIFGDGASNVTIENLTIDGNQTNQSVGSSNQHRGIFMSDTAYSELTLENLVIKNCVDHGVFLNAPTGSNVLLNLTAHDCGSAAHTSGGGAGGSGIVGGSNTVFIYGCRSFDNQLTGFKSDASQYFGCHANGNAGGFETGFNAAAGSLWRAIGCIATGNDGDGFRHLGEGTEIIMSSCASTLNGNSGIALGNAADRVQIIGCQIANNDQADNTRTASSGKDGITLFSTASTGPADVIISANQIYDDQGTPTQDYGVYVDDNTTRVMISSDNIMRGHSIAPIFIQDTGSDPDLHIRSFIGHEAVVKDPATTTLTGSTAETDLKSFTIPARGLPDGTLLKVYGAGGASGTNGTKVVRVKINDTASLVVSSQAAGDEQDWAFTHTILYDGAIKYRTVHSWEEGGTDGTDFTSDSASSSSTVKISVTGQLGNASDTITMDFFRSTIE